MDVCNGDEEDSTPEDIVSSKRVNNANIADVDCEIGMILTILSHIRYCFKYFAFFGSEESCFTFFWYIYCDKIVVRKVVSREGEAPNSCHHNSLFSGARVARICDRMKEEGDGRIRGGREKKRGFAHER